MFPNGVIYEGVSETPLSFRGESGANDSMVRILYSIANSVTYKKFIFR